MDASKYSKASISFKKIIFFFLIQKFKGEMWWAGGLQYFYKHFLLSNHLGQKFTTRITPLSKQATISTKEIFIVTKYSPITEKMRI